MDAPRCDGRHKIPVDRDPAATRVVGRNVARDAEQPCGERPTLGTILREGAERLIVAPPARQGRDVMHAPA